jgi:molybdate transport system substrate-binding protein
VKRALALAPVALVAVLVVGCGGSSSADSKPTLVVSAASSMTEALNQCSPDFADATVRLQFAGSDELAAQIEQGVKPDVYAAANTTLPDALHEKGLLSTPVKFATNEFVLAVSKDSAIASIDDLTAKGVKIAIGSESVPIGSYTRDMLAKLPPEQSFAIMSNVRSNEPDVKGIVGKLIQGAADAGFVYASDVNASGGELEAIELPAELDPTATYGVGVVKASEQPDAAEAFVDDLLAGGCHDALLAAGFGEP